VAIDEGDEVQTVRHGLEGSDIAMLVGADTQGGGRGDEEALSELIRCPSMSQG
jgi:hypothetical protein